MVQRCNAVNVRYTLAFADRVSGEGIAIGCVRLSIRLFLLYLLIELTCDFIIAYVWVVTIACRD